MGNQADRLYTAEQVRRLDRCAIEEHGIPGIELMERAGRSVFDNARRGWPEARRWVVFCGAGNNGGDGYVVARLALEAELGVTLFALKDPQSLSGDAAAAAQRWHAAGGKSEPWAGGPLPQAGLFVDALLGTGLDREPTGRYAEVIEALNHAPVPVISVDIPSGLQADTGAILGRAVRASLTVTFIGNKRGLFMADGPDYTGKVCFETLETPDYVRDSEENSGILVRESILSSFLPRRPRNSHKGQFGWLVGVGSDHGMSGAIRLCGEAALRTGAGKVTLVTRPEHAGLVNVACPELMVRGMDEAAPLTELLAQVDALVAGTGLGQSQWSREMLAASLAAPVPMVLDADGLNLLARLYESDQSPDQSPDLGRDRWVLTPHPAEAGRLLGCSGGDVQRDRVSAAQRLADRFRAVIVLKGCGTVIAEPGGGYAICPLGNPGMATAGTGDVLAGVIGALLAQGLDCGSAARCGVVAHAAAGDRAAARIGERGLMASDLSRELPSVLNPQGGHQGKPG